MDYKKKYEEALENIKAIKAANKDNKGLVDFIEFKYPELKESEDEKIRKALIHYFSEQDGILTAINGSVSVVDILAWLEKQKEHKPVISDDGLREGIVHFGITQYQIDNWLKKYVDVEKQGEQNNKHLYDVIIALWDLLDKIDTFSDLQIDDTNPDNPFKKIEYIAQERHKFVKSDGYNLYIQGEQITDFKQSKQKPAWSEEDEKHYQGCLNLMKLSLDTKPYPYYNDYLWLKSLKERYTWKPSDEQMDALNLAIGEANSVDTAAGDEAAEILTSLYEQLKKLKEE